ncbi:MAG: 4Fe-4S binding protein [Candidatus Brocadiia bacterium]
MDSKLTWKQIPKGGIIPQAGNSDSYKTGGWRTYKPLHNPANCINCLRCFYLCPDSSILVKETKVTGIDYDHCKGCGVCARECPVNQRENKKPNETDRKPAIKMVLEEN